MADPLGDSVPLTGDPRIDVVTQGGSWGFGGGPRVLTYSFNLAPDGANLLVGFTVGHEAEFVQCVTAGGNTTVKVDADCLDNGAKFTDVCVLTGVATDVATLLSDGNLVLT